MSNRRVVSILGPPSAKLERLCKLLCDEYDLKELSESRIVSVDFPSRRLGIKFKNGKLDSATIDAKSLGIEIDDVFHRIGGEIVNNDLRGIDLDRSIMKMVVSRPERPLKIEFRRVAPGSISENLKLMKTKKGSSSVLLRSYPMNAYHVKELQEANVQLNCLICLDNQISQDVKDAYAKVFHFFDASLTSEDIFAEIAGVLNISQPELSPSSRRVSSHSRSSKTSTSSLDTKGAIVEIATPSSTKTTNHVTTWKGDMTIKAGAQLTLPIVVPAMYADLSWDFETENGDIIFGATFCENNRRRKEIEELETPDRVDSHHSAIQRTVRVPSDGVVVLFWDNSYSWFAEKRIRYKVCLDLTKSHQRLKIVRKLQARMKVVLATMELSKLRKDRLGIAAMSIQSKVRGVLARKRAKHFKAQRAKEEDAREMLQRVARGRIARVRARNIRDRRQRKVRLMRAKEDLAKAQLMHEALDRLCDRHLRSFTLSGRSLSTKARDMQQRIESGESDDKKHLSMLRSQVAEWELETELLAQCSKSLEKYHGSRSRDLLSTIRSLKREISRLSKENQVEEEDEEEMDDDGNDEFE